MTHHFVLRLRTRCLATITLLMLALAALPAASQTFTTLYTFAATDKAASPPLTIGSDGSLFGAQTYGGALGQGSIFQLSPPLVAGGAWTETVIYNFQGGNDGSFPFGLVMDKGGNLYGTTAFGGTVGSCKSGEGTAFKLKPPAIAGGAWVKRIMHGFCQSNGDGYGVQAPLFVDSKGVVWGTNAYGGKYAQGTVFQIKSQGSGFVESILYNFNYSAGDGLIPDSAIVMDLAGNIFGTTVESEPHGTGGTTWELSPPATSGLWTEAIAYKFHGVDGIGTNPAGAIVLDKSGNLYGAAQGGGANHYGAIYQLMPPSAGQTTWSYANLWSFLNDGNGEEPASLIANPATGSLYGTTQLTGNDVGCGVAYQLDPPAVAGGSWQYKVLHKFSSAEGCEALGQLVRDSAGHLYGGTQGGTVFEITP